jgi:energy-coupling factor transport system permease protein
MTIDPQQLLDLVRQLLDSLVARTIISYLLIFTVPTLAPVAFIKLVGFEGLRHLFSYEPKQSAIHRLDPRLKVIYPVLIGAVSVFLNWDFVYGLAVITLIPWIVLRPSSQRARVAATLALLPVIGIIWQEGLFFTTGNQGHMLYVFPPTLSWLGTPGLSTSGLLYGLQQGGRTLCAVLASLILMFTTTPSEVVWAFYRFRLPAQAGLAFTAALRFLPQLVERLTVLIQVVQVRGYNLALPRWWQVYRWPGYFGRVIGLLPIVTIPLLINALRNTATTAMVVDARAFGAYPTRTSLRVHRFTATDALGWLLLLSLVAAVIALNVLGIANRHI